MYWWVEGWVGGAITGSWDVAKTAPAAAMPAARPLRVCVEGGEACLVGRRGAGRHARVVGGRKDGASSSDARGEAPGMCRERVREGQSGGREAAADAMWSDCQVAMVRMQGSGQAARGRLSNPISISRPRAASRGGRKRSCLQDASSAHTHAAERSSCPSRAQTGANPLHPHKHPPVDEVLAGQLQRLGVQDALELAKGNGLGAGGEADAGARSASVPRQQEQVLLAGRRTQCKEQCATRVTRVTPAGYAPSPSA